MMMRWWCGNARVQQSQTTYSCCGQETTQRPLSTMGPPTLPERVRSHSVYPLQQVGSQESRNLRKRSWCNIVVMLWRCCGKLLTMFRECFGAMLWQCCGDASAILCRWCGDVAVMRWKCIGNIVVVMWQCSLMLWRCVGEC